MPKDKKNCWTILISNIFNENTNDEISLIYLIINKSEGDVSFKFLTVRKKSIVSVTE